MIKGKSGAFSISTRKWILAGSGGILCVVLLLLFNANTFSHRDPLPEKVDFNAHVLPILSDKCFACHGPDEAHREADLRLDTREGAFAALKDQPGQYVLVAGKPEASAIFHRITSSDPEELMPPPESNLSLSTVEVKILEKWIRQGAEYKAHWAFIAPERPELPKVAARTWPNNEIDYFVLAQLESVGLSPNPPAEKARLLKRVALDLTGLPPTLDMQTRFMQDEGEDAYEKIVDELLQSPHYGEKMAISWLDVARYADSHGYQDDGLRTMWPWRDWVIHAFNENYPYDRFVTWQLAGDLLPNPTQEQLLATGFNRNHKITQEGGVIDEEYRIEYVTDRTNTFGKAFLALTFECAKCHSHKYDPISHEEYFQTFAFFNQVPEKGIVGTIDASFADPPNMRITDEDIARSLDFINKKDTAAVEVMVMKDSVGMRNTHVLTRGAYDAPAKIVQMGTPSAILPFDTLRFAPNRLGLAQWLISPENPLTARVYVNRVWQDLLGTGIVKTAGDFGMQGDRPTHFDLLDYLAVDFRENDWDIKALVKKIVMSATYRQSSEVDPKVLEMDPENRYLARFPRNRLSAELVRDYVLASADLLNPEIGGPSVKPYQPDGLWQAATSGRGLLQTYIQDLGPDLYRRGLYTFIKRTVPPPSMLIFDASNRDQCEVQRLQTNTPLQALVMLNDPTVLEASRVLATRLHKEGGELEALLVEAGRRVLCRDLKVKEMEVLSGYYFEELERFSAHPADAEALLQIGDTPVPDKLDLPQVAALMQVVHTLYNMEETVMKT